MNKHNHAIIVHGWEGSPKSNWFPWLSSELTKQGFTVSTPQFPADHEPTLASWLAVLRKETMNENTVLIGHSLGCIAILRALEQEGAKHVAGVVCVAGFSRNIAIPELMDFLNLPVDFASVRMHAQSFRVLQSDDDKVVPLAEAEVLAMGLHAPLVTLHKKGHFDEESGITECHPILDAVLSLVEE